tara:strand:+ start:1586 stop:1837 length:252 start_codon:yes stop_codon:yes gene_type:complete
MKYEPHKENGKYKPHFDMLMAREQLIEDMNSIVEDITYDALSPSEMNVLTGKLCDAVYKHLPTPKVPHGTQIIYWRFVDLPPK